jgi:RecA-family ATPase
MMRRNVISKEEEEMMYGLYQAIINNNDDLIGNGNRYDVREALTMGRWTPLTEGVLSQLYMAWVRGDAEEFVMDLKESEDPLQRRMAKIMLGELETEDYAEVGTLLSRVQPQKIPWLWYPRLALGKITMLDGDPGLGKSLIGADLGARITRGGTMPDESPCHAAGGVVVIMPEDTLEDTIQPRFARAGADLSKVLDISMIVGETRQPFSLQKDLDYLEAAIKRVNARLVYIDPIMALLAGNTNTNKDDDVRVLLLPLKMLVEKLQVACVLVRHMTKTRGENALMAGQGSIAFIGLARTGLTVARHPQNKSQIVLTHIKSNIGPLAPAMTYTISSDDAMCDERPYITWCNSQLAQAQGEVQA